MTREEGRLGLLPAAGLDEVGQLVRREVEAVGGPPARDRLQVGLQALVVPLDDLPVPVVLEPVGGDLRVGALIARSEREREAVGLAPADVDEPVVAEVDEQDQMRALGPGDAGLVVDELSREQRHVEA
jgi:hypothetical protein